MKALSNDKTHKSSGDPGPSPLMHVSSSRSVASNDPRRVA